ncbi:MAG: phosphomannomutase/phosphoglucomutase [Deltaproteobacteria bacterium]|nr:phosphomannomutase/phosphoglucomutase [Deltaproteobacteria bacterium]
MSIFKAYDIRGVVPGELDADAAYRIGRGIARHIDAPSLAIGRDARRSSPELFEALVRGVTDEGTDVADLGLVCTPMLYFAVDHLGSGGGIMLTASHNPAQYNGFKVCREHAIPIGEASGLKEIERLSQTVAAAAAAEPRGSVRRVDVRADYVDHVLAVGGGRPRLKVAIDCGNGMASVGLEPLLAGLDLEVERLYFEPDGSFPNHEADPLKVENLRDVCEAVKRSGADFGVAFDGDADRAVFVDEEGEPISSDLVTALLARRALRRHPGGTVLYDLRSSRVTAEEIKAAGGLPQMCRVGHSFVKAQMREVGAVFAGELSGHFYFRFSPTLVADDGIAAFVALLDVLAVEGQPLSKLVAPLRRYSASGEINRRVENIPGILSAIEAEHAGAAEISHLDGLLVRYPDWWFNLRPSNTEPVLRLNLEADSEARMVELRDSLLARIEAGG